jgi:hypothetical protein
MWPFSVAYRLEIIYDNVMRWTLLQHADFSDQRKPNWHPIKRAYTLTTYPKNRTGQRKMDNQASHICYAGVSASELNCHDQGLPGGAVVKGAVLQRQLCHQRLWVGAQALLQPAATGRSVGRRTIGPASSGLGTCLAGRDILDSSRTSDSCGDTFWTFFFLVQSGPALISTSTDIGPKTNHRWSNRLCLIQIWCNLD